MEISFIGTGNACNVGLRGQQAILAKLKENYILFDCGPTTTLNMIKFKIDFTKIDFIVFTHFHGDHIGGLPFLLLYLRDVNKRKKPLKIMGPVGIKEKLESLTQLLYPEIKFNFKIKYIELFSNLPFNSENLFKIIPFKMDHKDESLGYKLFYKNKIAGITGDTKYGPQIKLLADGCDLFISECTLLKSKNSVKHISSEDVKNYYPSFNSTIIALIHSEFDLNAEFNMDNLIFPNDGDSFTI
jgi:ribonuclease BN (tRNA processing enzyme)